MEWFSEADRYVSFAVADGNATVKNAVACQRIQGAEEFPGVAIKDVFTFFEPVQFFDDHDGDYQIMFIKMVNTGAVMQDDIGIENENLFTLPVMGKGIWAVHDATYST